MLLFLRFALVSIPFLLVSCVADKGKAERSADIRADGTASIENWVVKSLNTSRIYVIRVDGVLQQAHGKKGVYPLAPGVREIEVNCEFTRMPFPDLVIDAGMHRFRFEARAGTRYRVRGDKLSDQSAVLWIEELPSGRDIAERVEVPLTGNAQAVPIIVPIPAGG